MTPQAQSEPSLPPEGGENIPARRRWSIAGRPDRPEVVVLGGGFAGVTAARELANSGASVTVVDQNPYSTFQPLLYQVATGGLNPGDIIYPLRSLTARTNNERVVRGRADKVDTDARVITLEDGRTLDYDFLVVATGATTNYFGVPGAREHAQPLYTRADAIKLRDEVFGELEKAVATDAAHDRVTVVVVGGGATGVEMAGALAELRNLRGTPYPELSYASIVLIEMGPDLLSAFVSPLRRYARRALRKRGVTIRTSTTVQEIRADGVVVGDDHEFVPAQVVVWAAGVTTDPVMDDWGLARGRGGRLLVDDHLQVLAHPGVFAVGDVAVAARAEAALPQLATPAIQAGRHVGRQIRRLMIGAPMQPFEYHDKGTMATIGRRAAVADIAHGPRLTGTLAWLAWVFLHIVELLGGRNRAATLVNLTSRYLSWPNSTTPIIGD